MEIALYKLYGANSIQEHQSHMDEDKDWIRLSEFVEVNFVDLPPEDTIPPQLDLIDRGIRALREETAEKIARLEDQRAKLMALTHEPAAA